MKSTMKFLSFCCVLTLFYIATPIATAQTLSLGSQPETFTPEKRFKKARQKLNWIKGIRVGMNFNRMKLSRLNEYRGVYPKSGIEIGGYIGFAYEPSFERFMIHMEVLYSQANAAGSVLIEDIANDVDFRLDLLRFPILFSYTAPTERVRFMLLGGPNLGTLLGKKGKIEYDGVNYLPEFLVSPIVVGVSLGTGVMIPIQDKFELTIDSRFNLSYLNIFDTFTGIQFMMGIGF